MVVFRPEDFRLVLCQPARFCDRVALQQAVCFLRACCLFQAMFPRAFAKFALAALVASRVALDHDKYASASDRHPAVDPVRGYQRQSAVPLRRAKDDVDDHPAYHQPECCRQVRLVAASSRDRDPIRVLVSQSVHRPAVQARYQTFCEVLWSRRASRLRDHNDGLHLRRHRCAPRHRSVRYHRVHRHLAGHPHNVHRRHAGLRHNSDGIAGNDANMDRAGSTTMDTSKYCHRMKN